MKVNNGGFALVNAETGNEVRLAMEGLWLTGRVLPVGARLVVVHTFRSAEKKPLEVVYAFGLPRDAALRRFKIVGEGFQVRSELKPVQQAQADYEAGINAGHLASLARTYRDGRVNLSVGNVRPGELVKVFLELVAGVDLRDDGLRFRFPFTLAPCYHRDARAIEVEPGVGELELPEAEFGDILLPRYLTDPDSLHGVAFDLSVHLGSAIATVASPSHALRITSPGENSTRVSLSRERDVPDRDLVLDVQTREVAARWCGGQTREGKARFTAVIPSTLFGSTTHAPKSVVFILDRSGSMQGVPIEQAKKAIEACLGTLGNKDRFGFVSFDNQAEVFRPKLIEGTIDNRDEMRRFLSGVDARGGTELGAGIEAGIKLAGAEPDDDLFKADIPLVAATRPAGHGQAELFVVTDGQVSATENILELCRSASVRLHCLGIGAASQDRFLTLLARETGGVSRFLTPRERVDMGALELFAGIGQPVASKVEVSLTEMSGGHTVLTPQSVVYQGHPLLVMGEADGAANGAVRVSWGQGGGEGQFHVELNLDARPDGETVRLLQGARLITDVESRMTGERSGSASPKESARESQRMDAKLEQLSRDYGLASRAMALVAVVERPGDDASQVPITRVVPVGMPADTRFGSYFQPAQVLGDHMMAQSCDVSEDFHHLPAFRSQMSRSARFSCTPPPSAPAPNTSEDSLVEFAGRLLPDGGLPGQSSEERLVRSLLLLVAFLAFGHTLQDSAFRLHLQKLVAFIEKELPQVTHDERRERIERIIARARRGESFPKQLADRMLGVLDSASVAGWKRWKEFERELDEMP